MKDFFKKYAHFLVYNRLLVFLVILLITLIWYAGSKYVYTVSSFEKVLPGDVEAVKGAKLLRDNGVGQDGIAIALKINYNSQIEEIPYKILNLDVLKYLDRLTQEIKKDSDTVLVYSPSEIIKAFNNGKLPQNEEELKKLLNNPKVKEYLKYYINYDNSIILMFITTDLTNSDSALERYYSKIQELVKELGPPPGVEIKITGSPAIQQTLSKLIERDQSVTQLISTILVFLATVITFRSILAAIVPILIVTVANIWLKGFMGYFDIPLSTLAAGVAALVIGIGIDYSIHLMSRFKYERKKMKPIVDAVEEAVNNTGTSLIITALATIGAFLAFNVGDMPEMGKFGNLMALGIFFSLLLTLTLLPVLLIWEERIIYWILPKIRLGIEHEFTFSLIKEAIDIKSRLPHCSPEERKKLECKLNEIKKQLPKEELKKLEHIPKE
jgi:hydrophobe/amphiphile efflux-3 (HAE3) family protein